jgi:hypothetical protein
VLETTGNVPLAHTYIDTAGQRVLLAVTLVSTRRACPMITDYSSRRVIVCMYNLSSKGFKKTIYTNKCSGGARVTRLAQSGRAHGF